MNVDDSRRVRRASGSHHVGDLSPVGRPGRSAGAAGGAEEDVRARCRTRPRPFPRPRRAPPQRARGGVGGGSGAPFPACPHLPCRGRHASLRRRPGPGRPVRRTPRLLRYPTSPRACAASAPSATRWPGRAAPAARSSARPTAARRGRRLPPPSDTDRLDFRDIDAVDERDGVRAQHRRRRASRIYKTTDARRDVDACSSSISDPKAFFDAMAFWDARPRHRRQRFGRRRVRHHHDRERRPHLDARACRNGCRRRCRTKARSPRAARTSRSSGRDTSGSARARRHARACCDPPIAAATWQIAETPLAAGPSAGIYLRRVPRRHARRHRRRRLREGARSRRQRGGHERRRRDVDAGARTRADRIPFRRGARPGQHGDVHRGRPAGRRLSDRRRPDLVARSRDRAFTRSVSRPARRWVGGRRRARTRSGALEAVWSRSSEQRLTLREERFRVLPEEDTSA